MKNSLLSTIVIAGLAFGACKKPNIDAGDMTTEDRTVGAFTALEVDGSMDVYITQDSTYEVRVEAGDRLMQYIETEVSGSKLRVFEESNRVVRNRVVRVYVSASYLDRVDLDGSGDISGDDLNGNDVVIELDGSGDIELEYITSNSIEAKLDGSGNIELTGNTTTYDAHLKGSGDLDGRFLNATDAEVFLDGSGDLKVKCSNSLDASLYGSGNIYYWGSPTTVNTQVTGSGDIIEMQ